MPLTRVLGEAFDEIKFEDPEEGWWFGGGLHRAIRGLCNVVHQLKRGSREALLSEVLLLIQSPTCIRLEYNAEFQGMLAVMISLLVLLKT